MSLRFSDSGPAFPPQLVDALLSGDVVFFCGAGLSAPQLPGFQKLVLQCFQNLNIEMDPSEKLSFDAERYEEVLGTLRRRIVDPVSLIYTVSNLLALPANADLSHHLTILRLSRSLNNTPIIVTTNFDTLIEHAMFGEIDKEHIQKLSYAGQALPLPGSAEFGGIIHLHGRLADEKIGLDQTPLILTSADYGDAYMRSAWASRFLFDLVRCKTIVLIGYRAGDAPVRYFLNVLEADRERFPELKPVYAFDSVTADRTEANARWRTLAVTPLPYQVTHNEATNQTDYDVLWRDLSLLADLIEKPKFTRTAWAREALSLTFSSTNDITRDRVKWLFTDRNDLIPVLIDCAHDPAWFDFFQDNNLWSSETASWAIAVWVKNDLTSVIHFRTALVWYNKLGKPLLKQISHLMLHIDCLPDFWARAWKLLLKSELRRQNHSTLWYSAQMSLKHSPTLYSDLNDAIDCLTPTLTLSERILLYGHAEPVENPSKIAELVRAEMTVLEPYGASEIYTLLSNSTQIEDITQIAMSRFENFLGTSRDAELLDETFDSTDFSVPSIGDSTQNQHHDGVVYLIRLLAVTISHLGRRNRESAREYAFRCCSLPGRISTRLWLHILRDKHIFTSDEALQGLLELSEQDFWASRPEMPYVIKDRSQAASSSKTEMVERRIMEESDTHYERYQIDVGQVDWRGYARDSGVWLRLSMLKEAGAISALGEDELNAIVERRSDLYREPEERDFFGSYSYGVRSVVGNSKPIVEASADERIKIALDAMQSNQIENQHGWSSYCQSDIRGAYETLSGAAFDKANARLWRDYISALNFSISKDSDFYTDLVISTFKCLSNSDDQFLELIINQVASLYWAIKDRTKLHVEHWWERLFRLSIESERQDERSRDLFTRAINSASGQLMQTVIDELDRSRKANLPLSSQIVGRLESGATATGRGGLYAKAILLRDANFVLSIEGQRAGEHLRSASLCDNVDGADLRATLISGQSMSYEVSREFREQLLKGALEVQENENAISAASMVLLPPLSLLLGNGTGEDWGISIVDLRRTLREGSSALRRGALNCLLRWLNQDDDDERLWRDGVGPLLKEVWPRELRFRDTNSSGIFAALISSSGNSFPSALEQLHPFLVPLKGHDSLYQIQQSSAPEDWPLETLGLLWTLCGPMSDRHFHAVPEILKRISTANIKLEKDRRFQWLQQNIIQYG